MTPCKDVMLVCDLAQRALNNFIGAEAEIELGKKLQWGAKRTDARFAQAQCDLVPDLQMVKMSFKFRGETRTLTMFFGCDCDHEDLGPSSVSMSMGCSGHSDQFVKTVLHALSLLGPAYFDHNDCDDIDLAPLGEYRPSLMQAVNLKYLRSSQVEDTVERVRHVLSLDSKAARQAFIGLPSREIAELQKLFEAKDFSKSWDAIKELAATVKTPPVAFLSEYHETMAHAGEEVADSTAPA